MTDVYKKIESFKTREAATKYLKPMDRKTLDAIAKYYSVDRKVAKGKLIERIVEMTIGSSLKFDSLLGVNKRKK